MQSGENGRKHKPSPAIGLFDSGVGGVTVLKQLLPHLPQDEAYVYFGDTANLPYGDRSEDEIASFMSRIVPFLIEKGARAIAVACNYSSCVITRRDLEFPVPSINLVSAGIGEALSRSKSLKVGMLATPGTVATGAHAALFEALCPEGRFHAVACPRLVPLIEDGVLDGPEMKSVLKEYMAPLIEARCDTILLGCTHYPLVLGPLKRIAGKAITFIDPAGAMASRFAVLLDRENLTHPHGRNGQPRFRFFLSAESGTFLRSASEHLGFAVESYEVVQPAGRTATLS